MIIYLTMVGSTCKDLPFHTETIERLEATPEGTLVTDQYWSDIGPRLVKESMEYIKERISNSNKIDKIHLISCRRPSKEYVILGITKLQTVVDALEAEFKHLSNFKIETYEWDFNHFVIQSYLKGYWSKLDRKANLDSWRHFAIDKYAYDQIGNNLDFWLGKTVNGVLLQEV